jgi:hypothetical protein
MSDDAEFVERVQEFQTRVRAALLEAPRWVLIAQVPDELHGGFILLSSDGDATGVPALVNDFREAVVEARAWERERGERDADAAD